MGNYGPAPGEACNQCGVVSTTPWRRACSYCAFIGNLYRLYGSGRQDALYQVSRAVKAGHLPPAKTLICVDCGKPAYVYEHRDYNKPLDVVPCCRACNTRRGSAIPLKQTFEQFVARVQRLYPDATAEHFESIRRLYYRDEEKK